MTKKKQTLIDLIAQNKIEKHIAFKNEIKQDFWEAFTGNIDSLRHLKRASDSLKHAKRLLRNNRLDIHTKLDIVIDLDQANKHLLRAETAINEQTPESEKCQS